MKVLTGKEHWYDFLRINFIFIDYLLFFSFIFAFAHYPGLCVTFGLRDSYLFSALTRLRFSFLKSVPNSKSVLMKEFENKGEFC